MPSNRLFLIVRRKSKPTCIYQRSKDKFCRYMGWRELWLLLLGQCRNCFHLSFLHTTGSLENKQRGFLKFKIWRIFISTKRLLMQHTPNPDAQDPSFVPCLFEHSSLEIESIWNSRRYSFFQNLRCVASAVSCRSSANVIGEFNDLENW